MPTARDWERKQETEQSFDDAERIRLLYVGATRARDLLVISIRRTAAGKATGPWAAFDPFVTEKLPETSIESARPGQRLPSLASVTEELSAARAARANRRARAAVPSYATVS